MKQQTSAKITFYLSTLLFLPATGLSYYLQRIYLQSTNLQSTYLQNNTNDITFIAPLELGTAVIIHYLLLSILMLACWKSWCSISTKNLSNASDYLLLFFVAILSRLILVDVEPYLSNDIDRYLFDGKLALEGFDPYSINHEISAVANLREIWQPPPEHAQYPTIYPPLALALFSLASMAGAEWAPLVWKTITTLAGIVLLLLAFTLLKVTNKLQHFPLIALSPLLLLETGVGAHVDIFSALMICIAILAWQHDKFKFCGAALGLGGLVKLLPLLLMIPFFFFVQTLNNKLKLVVAAVLTFIGGYCISLALGLQSVGSLGTFFYKWRFGSPIFSALDYFFSSNVALMLNSLFLAIGLLTVAYFSLRLSIQPDRSKQYFFEQMATLGAVALALPLLLSPVSFPWYYIVLLPLVLVAPNTITNRIVLVWITLTPLSYEVLNGFSCCQLWQPAAWPLWTIGICSVLTTVFLYFQRRESLAY